MLQAEGKNSHRYFVSIAYPVHDFGRPTSSWRFQFISAQGTIV